MLRATGGVNTHRGAIFTLGLLCAAAGAARARAGCRAAPRRARHAAGALGRRARGARTRGIATRTAAARRARTGLRSASEEAALGLPTLFDHVLPALRDARRAGADARGARLHALFTAMADVDDTNLVHRGGLQGLRDAQSAGARAFSRAAAPRAAMASTPHGRIHREFVARRLSPGGAADMLAAACWIAAGCERI